MLVEAFKRNLPGLDLTTFGGNWYVLSYIYVYMLSYEQNI